MINPGPSCFSSISALEQAQLRLGPLSLGLVSTEQSPPAPHGGEVQLAHSAGSGLTWPQHTSLLK